MSSSNSDSITPLTQLPGWYPRPTADESVPTELRYWDGAEWTEQVATVGNATSATAVEKEPTEGVSRLLVASIGSVLAVVGIAAAAFGARQLNEAKSVDESTADTQSEIKQIQEQISVLDEG